VSQLFIVSAHDLPRLLSVGEPECQMHMRPWDGTPPSPIPMSTSAFGFLSRGDASHTCHVISRGTEIGC
jgi:hypothetical protein